MRPQDRRLCKRSHLLLSGIVLGTLLATAPAQAGLPLRSAQEANAGLVSGYQVSTGDKLRITVFDEPTLTGDYEVGDDGAVAFPLIDPVDVNGLTTSELAKAISTRLQKGGYVLVPKVAVEVTEHRPFYILGEVTKPGEYPYSGELTLNQAVAKAGGFTARANKRVIKLQRQSAQVATRIKLDGTPLKIAPGDTIIIQESFF
ncbi:MULTISPECIES: polysaccharide biosynthesis/export family protein [unclassified Novosphingobium]|uniref:polysaccharide biosynthesis/export family protein n=1 Tax=unclassified Novosphingobium TaxID=2644732 RepID=UPI00020EEA55|nr:MULTISPECIES: polysaccharide biosynthesis/export family protein [unclassified Novosphingobium]GFM27449.1 polysaccharide export protein [Novosphingobium sp. PY1]CCA91959.1 polysaccharide export protein [Novosphingobium sp. PP1Y]